jgi:hypothetical protein
MVISTLLLKTSKIREGPLQLFFAETKISADMEYQQIRVLRVGACPDIASAKKSPA